MTVCQNMSDHHVYDSLSKYARPSSLRQQTVKICQTIIYDSLSKYVRPSSMTVCQNMPDHHVYDSLSKYVRPSSLWQSVKICQTIISMTVCQTDRHPAYWTVKVPCEKTFKEPIIREGALVASLNIVTWSAFRPRVELTPVTISWPLGHWPRTSCPYYAKGYVHTSRRMYT
jgi:hypothetical protein